jgi:hypothetical protein
MPRVNPIDDVETEHCADTDALTGTNVPRRWVCVAARSGDAETAAVTSKASAGAKMAFRIAISSN